MKNTMFFTAVCCLILFVPLGLGGGALQDLAGSLKLLSQQMKGSGSVGGKKELPPKSLLVFDNKVDQKLVATVLANFCWLAVVEPLVRRKTYVGKTELSQASMTLLYALALLPETAIDLLITKANTIAQDKSNQAFAEGMGELEKILTDYKALESKPAVDASEAAASVIGQFSAKQLDDFLRDLFIVLFGTPLKDTGVLTGKSALFMKGGLSFPVAGEQALASGAVGFGFVLERLRLSSKNVNSFYQFLKSDIVGKLFNKLKDAYQRLEPLLKILETGKGWDAAVFKKEEEAKAEEKTSLDDKITEMVMRAFFDELFFDGEYSVVDILETWGTTIVSNGKPLLSFPQLYSMRLSYIERGQAVFFKMLKTCETLINKQLYKKFESDLLEKNKKYVSMFINAINNLPYSLQSDNKAKQEFIDEFKKIDANSVSTSCFPIAGRAFDATWAIVDGIVEFYRVKEEPVLTLSSGRIKQAPNGKPLFRAMQYNQKEENVEEADDKNIYWSEQALFILVETAFKLFNEVLKALKSKGFDQPSKFITPKQQRDFKFWTEEQFLNKFFGSEALMYVKTAAAKEFENSLAPFNKK